MCLTRGVRGAAKCCRLVAVRALGGQVVPIHQQGPEGCWGCHGLCVDVACPVAGRTARGLQRRRAGGVEALRWCGEEWASSGGEGAGTGWHRWFGKGRMGVVGDVAASALTTLSRTPS